MAGNVFQDAAGRSWHVIMPAEFDALPDTLNREGPEGITLFLWLTSHLDRGHRRMSFRQFAEAVRPRLGDAGNALLWAINESRKDPVVRGRVRLGMLAIERGAKE